MDQDMIAFFEDRFRATSQQIEGLREENKQQFEHLDGRMDKLDGRMDGLDGRMDGLDGRMDRLEEQAHQTRIVMEDMRGEIRLLAEGIIGVWERQDQFKEEVTRELKGVQYRLSVLAAHTENKGRDPIAIIRERLVEPL
ncbi:MAG TPA: hypothetical protein VIA62_20290 [Thermoanaerobaculia bacterium]|jgi:ABC-type phosphate transport system auxiliary subunit|nr:hypothetical protein [Thermoanaerobaculia bacterium]